MCPFTLSMDSCPIDTSRTSPPHACFNSQAASEVRELSENFHRGLGSIPVGYSSLRAGGGNHADSAPHPQRAAFVDPRLTPHDWGEDRAAELYRPPELHRPSSGKIEGAGRASGDALESVDLHSKQERTAFNQIQVWRCGVRGTIPHHVLSLVSI